MKKAVSFRLGESDFASLRQGQFEYVDKSLLIEEVITDAAKVLLIPRPRRFGKTLNLSMLRYFFEKPKPTEKNGFQTEDRRALFLGLAIEKSQEAWNHFQKYPVIFLTFKDVKASTWNDAFIAICKILAKLYKEHNYLQEGSLLSKEENELYQLILTRRATVPDCLDALSNLSQYLHAYHGEKVVILIDEYDTPIHSAYTNGYYDEAISFFRNFLSGAFKDNPHLYKGVLTGILRVAKESIFSGLNHLAVYSLLKPEFSTCFGFTEEEVLKLTQKMGHQELMTDIKSWYNGYLFGNTQIYNPWSILNFLASQDKLFRPYWVSTADNQIIRKLLLEQRLPLQQDLKTLLQGGSIPKPIEEHISFVDLEWSEQAIWSFLLFAGYLTPEKTYKEDDQMYAELRLVNQEIKQDFKSLTKLWFEKQLSGSMTVESLLQAVFSGNERQFQKALSTILLYSLSYHDFSARKKPTKAKKKSKAKNPEVELYSESIHPAAEENENIDPEAVYQAMMMGLLVNVNEKYEVKSNRESGYGRADILMVPKMAGRPGVVMEFKVADQGQNLEAALQEAQKQLEVKQYITELQQKGAHPMYEYAIAFFSKQVLVKCKKTD